MFCKSIILIACLVGVALGDSAPAFIWGSKIPSRPSLQTLSQDEFAELMEPELANSMFVVFLEPELSNIDFTCSKKSEESCYSNLKGIAKKTYYQKVQNPTEAMRQLSANREFATIDEAGNLENEIKYETGKVVFVSFESPSEAIDRNELLEFHDEAISKVYNKLAKQGPVTGVYTRTQSTNIGKVRLRRAAANNTIKGTVFRSTNVFLIYWTNLTVQSGTTEKVVTPIDIASMSLSDQNNTAFTVNLVGGSNRISFVIKLSGGYYTMSNLMLNNEGFYILPDITAPTNFSAVVGDQTFVSKSTEKLLMWKSLQLQAPFNPSASSSFAFGDAWYQVGFFTPGILAGLFVIAILLAILGLGVCWMMDINTMDRFDDPKGKTITINVNE